MLASSLTPIKHLMMVVLPAPLGPSRQKQLPGEKLSHTPRTAACTCLCSCAHANYELLLALNIRMHCLKAGKKVLTPFQTLKNIPAPSLKYLFLSCNSVELLLGKGISYEQQINGSPACLHPSDPARMSTSTPTSSEARTCTLPKQPACVCVSVGWTPFRTQR